MVHMLGLRVRNREIERASLLHFSMSILIYEYLVQYSTV